MRTEDQIQAEIDQLNKQISGYYTTAPMSNGAGKTWFSPNNQGSQRVIKTLYRDEAAQAQRRLADLNAELSQIKEYNAPENVAMREYQTSYNEAKAANEQRYQQALTGHDALTGDYARQMENTKSTSSQAFNEMLDLARQRSGQREADVNTAYQAQAASAQQQLARLGMANTTVAPTVRTGYERERQAELNRVSDAKLDQELNIMGAKESRLAGLSTQYAEGSAAQKQNKINTVVNRNDLYPEQNAFLSLLQSYGYGRGLTGK